MKKNIWKCILFFAVALVLVVGTIPISAGAAESQNKSGYTVTAGECKYINKEAN